MLITANSITFFPSADAAEKIAQPNRECAEDTDFIVEPAKGRAGKFLIAVFDKDGPLFLGYL